MTGLSNRRPSIFGMNNDLALLVAVSDAFELLQCITDSGTVYSDSFGLNLRRRTDEFGAHTYAFDGGYGSNKGISATCGYDDGGWPEIFSASDVWENPEWLNLLNGDTDILARTLESPLHFRRGGDSWDDHHAVFDQLARKPMSIKPTRDLVALIDGLASAHPLTMAPSAPWDSVPYPATSDQDFSIVADPEGEMLILRLAEGTWLVRLDQAGIDWILMKLAVQRAILEIL